jgi:hypothetical protein
MIIRQLAQCPYCQGCEVALTDSPDIVFNPDAKAHQPCPHLVLVEGRYSQYTRSSLPGRQTKIARMIGSTEFEWLHAGLAAGNEANQVRSALRELTTGGGSAESALTVIPISKDQTVTEGGKSYPDWEIEGAAIFALDAAAFASDMLASYGPQEGEEENPFDFS